MSVKQWSVGDILTAADMNAWAVPLVAVKASDTARSATITLAADPDLSVSVAASATYQVETFIFYDGSTSGDLVIQFSGPSGATFTWVSNALIGGAASASDAQSVTAQTIGGNPAIGAIGVGSKTTVQARGILTTSTTAGSFTLLWAQSASNATATTVYAPSAMILRRIG